MAHKYKKYKFIRGNRKRSLALTAFAVIGIGLVLFLFVLALGSQQKGENLFELDLIDKKLSQQVKSYEPIVREELEEHGKEKYIDIVLALMMQESGGRGNDPMQASESLCGEVGCIDDPRVSIEHGVSHFVAVLESAGGDVKLALQSYNFGGGFIDFVERNGGEYTEELAIAYSQKKYAELASEIDFRCIREISKEKNACYGDVKYVDAVLAYYEDAREYTKEDPVLFPEK